MRCKCMVARTCVTQASQDVPKSYGNSNMLQRIAITSFGTKATFAIIGYRFLRFLACLSILVVINMSENRGRPICWATFPQQVFPYFCNFFQRSHQFLFIVSLRGGWGRLSAFTAKRQRHKLRNIAYALVFHTKSKNHATRKNDKNLAK
jgi:hypothetical protein